MKNNPVFTLRLTGTDLTIKKGAETLTKSKAVLAWGEFRNKLPRGSDAK